MVLSVRLEAERIGQPDLSWRGEAGPGGASILLEAEDVYVGVVPVVDVTHVDLHAPINVAHDLGTVAEGQVDSEIGIRIVALFHEWLVYAETFVKNYWITIFNHNWY